MSGNTAEAKLGPRLRRAREVAAKLAAESDALNNLLKVVEQALRDLNLGIAAYAELDPADDDREGKDYGVFFLKDVTLGWALQIEAPNTSGVSTYTSIHSVARDLRVRAAKALPTLVDNLLAAAEVRLNEVSAATACVSEVVEDLGEAKS